MPFFKERLKEILIRDNLIKNEDLEKALGEQKASGEELSKILVRLKLIDEDTLTHILSEGLGLPPISISRLKIDPGVVKILSREIAMRYQVIPISLIGDHLTLAMADPLNIFAIDNLKTLTGYTINPIIAKKNEIKQAIEEYYKVKEKTVEIAMAFENIIKDIQDNDALDLMKDITGKGDQAAMEEIIGEAPIIKLTNAIVNQGVLAKASDIFIEPLEKTMRIRYRIDGIIREVDRMSKGLHFPIISRIKVISNLDISEHRLPQDGRFRVLIGEEREIDFRVNVLPTAFGEKIVLRILDKDSSVVNIEKLGFEEEILKELKNCSLKPHGMILVCGPTGSGKTTTLYSVVQYINSPTRNIVTVEDPIEYQVKGINQVNVRPEVGLSFATSLRSILRQDPDIILIGEIRDSETLDIAVKAALTGHLVLSSLHTTTAAGSVVRMMNMGIEPFLICSSVLAILAQRLLRRICPKCKEEYILTKPIAEKVGLTKISSVKEFKLFRGKGCPHCFNTGYKGRVGITEMMVLSSKIRDLILNRAGEVKIKQAARAEGMKTMRGDGLFKVLAGMTTLEEVLRVTTPDED